MIRLLVVFAVLLSGCNLNGLQTKSAATGGQDAVMPELNGIDHRGQPFSLSEARARGPVVVIFYRGHW